jgi:hypothetical protein
MYNVIAGHSLQSRVGLSKHCADWRRAFVPVYFCRWPNGDLSIVSAPNREEAVVRLDEFGNADGVELELTRFAAMLPIGVESH